MATAHVLKNNFTGGETTPWLDGRTDAAAVQAGCRVLENFIVRPYGGISRRPGTQWIANTEACRLIPFRVSQTENYMLEVGPNYMKVWDTDEFSPGTLETMEYDIPIYQFNTGYNASEYVRILLPTAYNATLSTYGDNLVLQCINTFDAADYNTTANNAISAIKTNTYTTWKIVPKNDSVNNPIKLYSSYFSVNTAQVASNARVTFYLTVDSPSVQYSSIWANFWFNPSSTNTVYQSTSAGGYNFGTGLSGLSAGITTLLRDLSAVGAPNNVLKSQLSGSNTMLVFADPQTFSIPTAYPRTPATADGYSQGYCTAGYVIRTYNSTGTLLSTVSSFDTLNGTANVSKTVTPASIDSTIYSPYSTEDDIKNLQYVQLNDVMFFASENHYPYRLSRMSSNEWVMEPVPYEYAPVLDVNETTAQVQLQYDYPDWNAPIWEAGTNYLSGDRVYENQSPYEFYVCILDNFSANSGTAGANEPGTASGVGEWVLFTYNVGDRVVNDLGVLYTCHTAHTPVNTSSSNLGQPGVTTGNWSLYWNEGTSSEVINAWAAGTVYNVGDKVRFGKVIYTAIQKHKAIAPRTLSVFDGASDVLVNSGNRPGFGKLWTRYWRVGSSQNTLSDVKLKLLGTDDVFLSTDVDTKMQLKIGIPNYFIDQKLGTLASNAEFGPSEQIFVQGEYLVTTQWSTGSALIGNITLEESLDGVVWTTAKEWTFTNSAENNISYSGEAPATGAWYRFRGYKKSGGQRSVKMERINSFATVPFKITDYVAADEVKGNVDLPNNQLPPAQMIGVSTKYFYRPAFSPTEGYPRAVAFYENRLWWAGTEKQKGRLWASNTDDFYNYLVGTNDTDGIDVTLAATETNEINWIKPFNKSLVVATAGEVWTIDSGEQGGIVSPTTVTAKVRLRVGASRVEPQITSESLLWVQNSGKSLREFAYRFEADQFTAPDMTLFSAHVARNGIEFSAFQMNPEPIWWGVTDGELIGLTYNREQQVVAWHRHVTGLRDNNNSSSRCDKFINVAVVTGNYGIDQVWLITKRYTIGGGNEGTNKIERFHPPTYNDMFTNNYNSNPAVVYVDCALRSTTVQGTNALSGSNLIIYPEAGTTFDNLLFANNVQVQPTSLRYYKDNQAIKLGETTTAGPTAVAIAFNSDMAAASARSFEVGIPFMSVAIPNHIDIPLDNGTSLARKTRINRIVFNVVNTLGGGYQLLNGDTNTLAPSAQAAFEKKPLYTDSYDLIDYNGMIQTNHTTPERRTSYPSTVINKPYTGMTADQSINSDHMTDLVYAIIVKEPVPFNLLSVVQKLEVTGN